MSRRSRRRRRRRHHHARLPAVTPLDDDDLLCEILLRLPPQPSSLPRASAVCKRWRSLVSDPGFSRRFCLHHRRSPPLLGFYERSDDSIPFVSTLEAPNRIPPERLSLPPSDGDRFRSIGCRHGLLLIRLHEYLKVLVLDPVTGEQHRIPIPAAFDSKFNPYNGAVLRSAGETQHFQVVLAVADFDDRQHVQGLACIYSSKTGLWGDLISTPIPYQASVRGILTMVHTEDTLLAGNSLYWMLIGNLVGILEFDLVKQSLGVIRLPEDICLKMAQTGAICFKMMRAEGGGLGFLVVSVSDCTVQLWKRKTDCHGIASWGLARTIQLDKLLSLKSEEKGNLNVLGYAEENNVLFLWTRIGSFMIDLESLKFKQKHALVVSTAELSSCSIRNMIVRVDMLSDLLVELVSRVPVLVAQMEKWVRGCWLFHFLCSVWRFTLYVAHTDQLRS